MKPSITRFAKTAGTFFVGNVLSKLIAVFLLPIYTAYLSPGEYGTYDVSISILNMAVPVLFTQIWDGMYRFVFDCEDSESKYRVVSNSLVVCGVGCCAYSIAFLLLRLVAGQQLSVFMWLYGLTLPLQYELSYIARSFFQNVLFSISGVANALASALLNIVLICGFHWGIDSIFLSAALGNCIQILAIGVLLNVPSHFRWKLIDTGLMWEMVRFSIPLCLASLSFWLYNGFTKVIISMLLGVSDNGLYGVITRFTAAVTMVASVFQFAWSESSYSIAGNAGRKAIFSQACEVLLLCLVALSTLFPYVVRAIFPYFVDVRYQAAVSLLPIATVGVVLNAYASFLATIFATERQTKVTFISTVIGALVNIVCCPVLIGMLGLMGAVTSLSLAYASVALVRLLFLKKQIGVALRFHAPLSLIPLGLSFAIFESGNQVLSVFFCITSLALCGLLLTRSLKREGLER